MGKALGYAVVLAFALAMGGCATGQNTASEVIAYGIPYTTAKMEAACAQPQSDVVAQTACLNMRVFAQACLANIPAQGQAVNAGLGIAGAVAGATGNAPVAAGTTVAGAVNSAALVPLLTMQQLALCQSGGFPTGSAPSK